MTSDEARECLNGMLGLEFTQWEEDFASVIIDEWESDLTEGQIEVIEEMREKYL